MIFARSYLLLSPPMFSLGAGVSEEELEETRRSVREAKSSELRPVHVHSMIIAPHKPETIHAMLCPRLFGHPNHRMRSWRIIYNKRKKAWTSPFSLAQLAELILAPWDSKSKLTYKSYLVASRAQLKDSKVYEEQLSR